MGNNYFDIMLGFNLPISDLFGVENLGVNLFSQGYLVYRKLSKSQSSKELLTKQDEIKNHRN